MERRALAQGPKTLNMQYFIVIDQVEIGNLVIEHCPTDDIVGDFHTKPFYNARSFKDFVMQFLDARRMFPERTEYRLSSIQSLIQRHQERVRWDLMWTSMTSSKSKSMRT
jgi:hypothetical protein